jgi:hypothetical protein
MQHEHEPKPPPATRYQITHHTEEWYCAICGAPLYVGDYAYDFEEEAYCSTDCLQQCLPNKQQEGL